MESNFHDRIDYNGVAFSIEVLEWGPAYFRDFGVTILWQVGSLGIKKKEDDLPICGTKMRVN